MILAGKRGLWVKRQTNEDFMAIEQLVCVVGPDGQGGFTQRYCDARGVVRVYEMKFGAGRWERLRVNADFTPLDFSQRYVGQFSADRSRIDGAWESSRDGQTWELDFQLNYFKLA